MALYISFDFSFEFGLQKHIIVNISSQKPKKHNHFIACMIIGFAQLDKHIAELTDIKSQNNTRNHGQETHNEFLLCRNRRKIPESNSSHNNSAPIKGSIVKILPLILTLGKPILKQPIDLRIQMSHGQ